MDSYPSDCQILESMRENIQTKSSKQLSAEQKRVLARAKEIKLLLLDVDGVLTDGSLLYTGGEIESKCFNTLDGFGLTLLRQAGVEVGIITARKSEVVARRAAELKMEYIYQGARNKNIAFKEILAESGYKPVQIAYMGDDWLDLVLLQQVGLAATPANGAPEVQERVHLITQKEGGHGAVRELCDTIIAGKEMTEQLLQKYLSR